MAEFCDELTVVSANYRGEVFRAELSELLPRAKAGILDK
jgi:hypothetical protein